VSHSTNESDANTLPDPELNPLLNPLLAAHMGRWAEVYFTNPPEKRGEAITELLRELRNLSPAESDSIQIVHDQNARERENGNQNTVPAEAPDLLTATAAPGGTCHVCAHENSAGQRFCGMCGVSLQVAPETLVSPEAEPIATGSWCDRSFGENSVADAIDFAVAPINHDRPQGVEEPVWAPAEKYLPDLDVESQSAPHHYRVLGVVVAILLAVMIYMAWRTTRAPSRSALQQTLPARTVRAESAAATPAPQPASTGSTLPGSAPAAPSVKSQKQPDATSPTAEATDAPPVIVPVNASAPLAAEQNGAEELALAEKYLNGNQGVAGDKAEAALWLWKAVGKGNLAATMTLSDLYLRGDGVAKSCDQARVLLDAAARKGGKAAAERLRNLQAFDCE